MVDLIEEVRDLNYIVEGDFVEIMEEGKNYTFPYVCVLRHQDKRFFELLKTPFDEDMNSNRLVLSQSMKDPNRNSDRFKVVRSRRDSYENWHYNYFGKNKIV